MDRPGKDTWRYAEAGCESIAISGRRGSALLTAPPRRAALRGSCWRIVGGEVDLVLVEGLHDSPLPKIEVHRAALGRGLRCKPEELLAVVTDEPLESGCRRLRRRRHRPPSADLIERRSSGRPRRRRCCWSTGRRSRSGSFTQRMLARTIVGCCRHLKGIGGIKTVSVSIRSSTRRFSGQ